MIVLFTPEARDAVRAKRAWWEVHRDKAPHLFRMELKEAVAALRVAPTEGAQPYMVRNEQVIWRRRMTKTRHHVYYRIHELDSKVEVLTLWNAQGGTAPEW